MGKNQDSPPELDLSNSMDPSQAVDQPPADIEEIFEVDEDGNITSHSVIDHSKSASADSDSDTPPPMPDDLV